MGFCAGKCVPGATLGLGYGVARGAARVDFGGNVGRMWERGVHLRCPNDVNLANRFAYYVNRLFCWRSREGSAIRDRAKDLSEKAVHLDAHSKSVEVSVGLG